MDRFLLAAFLVVIAAGSFGVSFGILTAKEFKRDRATAIRFFVPQIFACGSLTVAAFVAPTRALNLFAVVTISFFVAIIGVMIYAIRKFDRTPEPVKAEPDTEV